MDWNKILNWKLLAGSHDFPGPDGGTCINEAAIDPTGSLPATVPGSASLSGAPTSWVSSQNGATNAYRVGLDGVEGVHAGGSLIVRYVLFRTANNVPDTNAGPAVGVTVSLKERTGGDGVSGRAGTGGAVCGDCDHMSSRSYVSTLAPGRIGTRGVRSAGNRSSEVR